MIDADVITRIYRDVVQGVEKDASAYVTDEESGALYDTIAGEVEAVRGTGVQFAIPHGDDTFDVREFDSKMTGSPYTPGPNGEPPTKGPGAAGGGDSKPADGEDGAKAPETEPPPAPDDKDDDE